MPEVIMAPTVEQIETPHGRQSSKRNKATTHQFFNANSNMNMTQFQPTTVATAHKDNISTTNPISAQWVTNSADPTWFAKFK